jgi:hypothetical protein
MAVQGLLSDHGWRAHACRSLARERVCACVHGLASALDPR